MEAGGGKCGDAVGCKVDSGAFERLSGEIRGDLVTCLGFAVLPCFAEGEPDAFFVLEPF